MSERKSWDIQPKRRVAAPAPAQQARPAPQRVARPEPRPSLNSTGTSRVRRPAPAREKQRPQPAIRVVRPAPQSAKIPKGREREPLKARRRRARNRTALILFILSIFILIAVFASFWSYVVRIQHIQTGGPDASGMQAVAAAAMQGTYDYLIPRNSIFFFPESDIRAQILNDYPDISAVSISRVSFDTIAVISIPREAALTWCGATYIPQPSVTQTASSTVSEAENDTCYSADAQGILFAPLSADVASSSDALKIYDPLANPSVDTASPLGAVIGQAALIPNALQFVKAIKSLGVPIVSLVIRGDEADLYAQSGTRITYVLGHEQVAAQLAESAFPSLNLNDGSLEYVDLRFDGKVYFKKFGDASGTEASSTSSQ